MIPNSTILLVVYYLHSHKHMAEAALGQISASFGAFEFAVGT